MINTPNFFIVGAAKCGTTSLYEYLKQHPDIFMSSRKELNYFCGDLLLEGEKFNGNADFPFPVCKSENEYLENFTTVNQESVVGEASVHYLASHNAAKLIFEFNPKAKIIIMLRDPISFMTSWHSELSHSHHENEDDFAKALELEKERINGTKIPKYIPWPSILYYKELATFSVQVKRFLDVFPADQIKICLLDDLKVDVESFYNDVVSFLEVSGEFIPEFGNRNLNKVPRFKFKYLPLVKQYVTKYCGKKLRSFLSRNYSKINSQRRERESIDKNLEADLKKGFKAEVEELSKLLDRDLINLWNY
jgi:hypothetical protein